MNVGKRMTLKLLSAAEIVVVEGVTSFVGEDASGSFGIMPGHARFMTCLQFGLARYRCGQTRWHYVALPGAVLYCINDCLSIATRRFVVDDNYENIAGLLSREFSNEEETFRVIRQSLAQLERELGARMYRLGKGGESF